VHSSGLGEKAEVVLNTDQHMDSSSDDGDDDDDYNIVTTGKNPHKIYCENV
jgi:hypothetical protein